MSPHISPTRTCKGPGAARPAAGICDSCTQTEVPPGPNNQLPAFWGNSLATPPRPNPRAKQFPGSLTAQRAARTHRQSQGLRRPSRAHRIALCRQTTAACGRAHPVSHTVYSISTVTNGLQTAAHDFLTRGVIHPVPLDQTHSRTSARSDSENTPRTSISQVGSFCTRQQFS